VVSLASLYEINTMTVVCVETAFYKGLLKERYKGGIEVTRRQIRRRRKLLDDLKERRGCSHLKEEALDRTMWRDRFGRGFGPVVKQTTKWMNFISICCREMRERWSNFYNEVVTFRTTRFNIHKLYKVLTLRLGVSYRSQNRQRMLPYATLTDWFL
jgi:hypothetical protein